MALYVAEDFCGVRRDCSILFSDSIQGRQVFDLGISPEATLMLRCTCFGFASYALFARSVSFRSTFLFAVLMMVAISFRHIEGISCSCGWFSRFN